MSASARRLPLLFERYPALAEGIPWRSLGSFPTPVQLLHGLGGSLGHGALYAKRDDLSGETYGGNKVRKLEFLLADALVKGRREVVTFGAVGSNHVVATAVYARELGLDSVAVVVPQPGHPYVGRNLRAASAAGCRYVAARSPAEALWSGIGTISWEQMRGRKPYFVPPGGSNALGCLGYVEAGLEIAQQVADGVLPVPDDVYLPAGSLGSAVGLALGLKLARTPSRVVAVRVYERAGVNLPRARKLFNATLRLLRKHDANIPTLRLTKRDFALDHSQFGRGYASFTAAGEEAVALFAEMEDLTLEGTYTGKAAAALLEAARRPENARRTMLFVNTYNSRPLAEGDTSALPDALKRYL